MKRITLQLFVTVACLMFTRVVAQEEINLQVSSIDPSLLNNANAVVRSETIEIQIGSIKSINVRTKRIVTVLNKDGRKYADSYEFYDPYTKIKKLEATILDETGKEIKKYKKKDFIDRSVYDGISLMNDNRMQFYNYTPINYPYTVVFESEVESSTTAFIRPWEPIRAYRLSVEKSSYNIVNQTGTKLRYKEFNFKGYDIEGQVENEKTVYEISDIKAKLPEVNSPSKDNLLPKVRVALNNFSLANVEGYGMDWKTFGKWQYDKLIEGRDKLPSETIAEVNTLVSKANTDKEKAKLIYEYVQGKTRYISVQLGIGGWMPFLAEDVDRLGYGDCKALTNYTKALLDSQGITSYYTVVYGDEKRDVDAEFAAMEGNHVILNIPNEDEDIWLECTSQTLPFNFIGDFTDDRNVLVVKPDGGEIKRTKKYTPEENLLTSKAIVNIHPDNSMYASLERVSEGLEYNWKYGIQFMSQKDQKLHYKEVWDYINGLEVSKIELNNDKDKINFTEKLEVSCSSYGKKIGSRLLITPNVFNCDQSNFPKYENRQTELVITKGYINKDEYILNIPNGYTLGKIPEKKELKTEFGAYSYQLEKITDSQIKFTRFLKILDGTFPKEKYEEYRNFRSSIKKIDKSRIVLNKQ
ncbi:DUF3857 domain-containing protein [Aquimarina sp. D1M17]|uniref:DUF3857 domain-containing protein n=1 Tax=Aquimarina acroporae TaxID=2937283 RepID=UPI0020C063FE|nr:DUF3857 domain-containing protein [Aquimarina acroporae]MCK8522261.1 DUF3857 domain-containing protein [Aquimarina acroporae]